jgi:cell wall-associated NlpC family hydrolase
MSYLDALRRVDQIQALVSPQPPPVATAVGTTSFSTALHRAQFERAPVEGDTPSILTAAENEVGVTEEPPGSNDGTRIADYRSAVAGAAPGQPWCATFVSWAAAQAGTPLGDAGQGLNSVSAITEWAGRTGRLVSSPEPGDLILFGDQHVGIVEAVDADGTLTTVEGNEGDAVTRRERSPSEATGYVKVA